MCDSGADCDGVSRRGSLSYPERRCWLAGVLPQQRQAPLHGENDVSEVKQFVSDLSIIAG